MGDNSSEVFDHDAEMKTFLDIEFVKVFSLKCDGGMHGLLQNL